MSKKNGNGGHDDSEKATLPRSPGEALEELLKGQKAIQATLKTMSAQLSSLSGKVDGHAKIVAHWSEKIESLNQAVIRVQGDCTELEAKNILLDASISRMKEDIRNMFPPKEAIQ